MYLHLQQAVICHLYSTIQHVIMLITGIMQTRQVILVLLKAHGIPTELTKTLRLSVCHTLTYMYTVTHMHTHYEVQYNLQSTLLSCEESISRPYFSARMLAIHPKY